MNGYNSSLTHLHLYLENCSYYLSKMMKIYRPASSLEQAPASISVHSLLRPKNVISAQGA